MITRTKLFKGTLRDKCVFIACRDDKYYTLNDKRRIRKSRIDLDNYKEAELIPEYDDVDWIEVSWTLLK